MKKKIGRSTAYSCKTNIFIQFHRFKKKQSTQLNPKPVKQDILNQWGSKGFPKLKPVTVIKGTLRFSIFQDKFSNCPQELFNEGKK